MICHVHRSTTLGGLDVTLTVCITSSLSKHVPSPAAGLDAKSVACQALRLILPTTEACTLKRGAKHIVQFLLSSSILYLEQIGTAWSKLEQAQPTSLPPRANCYGVKQYQVPRTALKRAGHRGPKKHDCVLSNYGLAN